MTYYIEVNLIAIIVGLILLIEARRMTSAKETSQIILNWMIVALILFSISDIFAYVFRGKSFIGVQISNMFYFITLAIGSYMWFLFAMVKTGSSKRLKTLCIFSGIPMAILCIAILTNPWTQFFFSVDADLIYHRNTGVMVTWIIEWTYIFSAVIVLFMVTINEKRTYLKQEYLGYLFFFVPLAVAAVIQMAFYGTTTSQIGMMLALLMAYTNRQFHQVQRDSLTGLNNKNAYLSFRDSIENRNRDDGLTIFMIDADYFKAINDTYGHLQGDQALKDIADILRKMTSLFTSKRLILYRYAGDEFIILGTGLTEEDLSEIPRLINECVDQKNEENKKKNVQYHISLSIGYASSVCVNASEFDHLMKKADENMYQIKGDKKRK